MLPPSSATTVDVRPPRPASSAGWSTCSSPSRTCRRRSTPSSSRCTPFLPGRRSSTGTPAATGAVPRLQIGSLEDRLPAGAREEGPGLRGQCRRSRVAVGLAGHVLAEVVEPRRRPVRRPTVLVFGTVPFSFTCVTAYACWFQIVPRAHPPVRRRPRRRECPARRAGARARQVLPVPGVPAGGGAHCVAELEALRVVFERAALRRRRCSGSSPGRTMPETQSAFVWQLRADELRVDAVRVELPDAAMPTPTGPHASVRRDDELGAEIAVDVGDDRVLDPRARRVVLREEHGAVEAGVDAREALVGVDDLGVARRPRSRRPSCR